jgi:hypothetical protein
VDVENVDSSRFDALTALVFNSQAQTQGRLNEVNIGAMTFEFWIFFSFEESGAGEIDAPHYAYTQQRYYLGPLHRIADPITGTRLPWARRSATMIADGLPALSSWRQAPTLWPQHCDGFSFERERQLPAWVEETWPIFSAIRTKRPRLLPWDWTQWTSRECTILSSIPL